MFEILFLAEEQIKIQVDWQLEIQKEVGVAKCEVSNVDFWQDWEKKVGAF